MMDRKFCFGRKVSGGMIGKYVFFVGNYVLSCVNVLDGGGVCVFCVGWFFDCWSFLFWFLFFGFVVLSWVFIVFVVFVLLWILCSLGCFVGLLWFFWVSEENLICCL